VQAIENGATGKGKAALHEYHFKKVVRDNVNLHSSIDVSKSCDGKGSFSTKSPSPTHGLSPTGFVPVSPAPNPTFPLQAT